MSVNNPVPTSCGGFTQNRIRATNYADVTNTWYEASLPWPGFKRDFQNGTKHWVMVTRTVGATSVTRLIPIKEDGPINEYDNYWVTGTQTPAPNATPTGRQARDMFQNLCQWLPQSEWVAGGTARVPLPQGQALANPSYVGTSDYFPGGPLYPGCTAGKSFKNSYTSPRTDPSQIGDCANRWVPIPFMGNAGIDLGPGVMFQLTGNDLTGDITEAAIDVDAPAPSPPAFASPRRPPGAVVIASGPDAIRVNALAPLTGMDVGYHTINSRTLNITFSEATVAFAFGRAVPTNVPLTNVGSVEYDCGIVSCSTPTTDFGFSYEFATPIPEGKWRVKAYARDNAALEATFFWTFVTDRTATFLKSIAITDSLGGGTAQSFNGTAWSAPLGPLCPGECILQLEFSEEMDARGPAVAYLESQQKSAGIPARTGPPANGWEIPVFAPTPAHDWHGELVLTAGNLAAMAGICQFVVDADDVTLTAARRASCSSEQTGRAG